MSLSVLVKSASGLPNVERFSKSDPMCVIILEGVFTPFSSRSCDRSLMYHIITFGVLISHAISS